MKALFLIFRILKKNVRKLLNADVSPPPSPVMLDSGVLFWYSGRWWSKHLGGSIPKPSHKNSQLVSTPCRLSLSLYRSVSYVHRASLFLRRPTRFSLEQTPRRKKYDGIADSKWTFSDSHRIPPPDESREHVKARSCPIAQKSVSPVQFIIAVKLMLRVEPYGKANTLDTKKNGFDLLPSAVCAVQNSLIVFAAFAGDINDKNRKAGRKRVCAQTENKKTSEWFKY